MEIEGGGGNASALDEASLFDYNSDLPSELKIHYPAEGIAT